ncbi:AI-2E family transporter [Jannaschia sp. M317]|uniref:AI-2E family transporter n=1 Tax=Jannaschia sp. M317 TaxID=2867011 RepID=UPI0021A4B03F|nr:AI-2E family transporter [Jannaschia sp. M317]UWQ18058.1 AI-2E family transporter [Jannaschia sp. M317]
MTVDRQTRIAVTLLAVIATLAVLREASALFAPVVLALVIGVVLSPLARRIDRLGAPAALSAFLTLAIMLGMLAGLAVLIEPVISSLVRRAPVIWLEIRETIADLRGAITGLDRVSESVSEALAVPGTARATDDGVEIPSLRDALLLAPNLAAWLLLLIGTLYFFLLSRRDVYAWVTTTDLAITIGDMLEAEREVSRYFLTITCINAVFGIVVTLALWLIGMPFAALWGFIAFLANFILYLGPAIFAVSLLVGGVVAFDGLVSFLPAAVFVGLNLTEGQFVTPGLVGRQMSVNPLLVFLSLVFWLWLWGPIGGIIAIPLLVWILVIQGRHKKALASAPSAPDQ